MRFSVLGPFEVERPEGPVAVGGPKERVLLAALVLRANAVVTTAQLVSDLWGEDPPRSAAKTVQTYVSHVRRALADVVIETAGAGYRLVVDADAVDALRFERLVNEGHAALRSGDARSAARSLDAALALWRGDPLAEFDEAGFASAEATRLGELRLEAIEHRVEAGLALGEERRLVGELQRLVRAHPLRERLWGQLMLALYRSGRQADALAAYQQARRHLVEEIGVEPGEELRALERALLEQDPALGGPLPTRPPSTSEGETITVTVLLTDIEASTRLWEAHPASMATAVAELERIVRDVVTAYHGTPVKTRGEGDSTFSVFARATDALRAGLAFQQAVARLPAIADERAHVRVALHTGEVQARDGDYYGRALNRAARVRALAPGGVVLVSGATAALVADDLPEDAALADLGTHELRDLVRPEHIFALVHPDLAPPPDLPRERTGPLMPAALLAASERPMVGRTRELDRLTGAWQRARTGQLGLVLVAGEPGIGKTRLAAELARIVTEAGGQVLLGRCDEAALTPYQPFVEAIGDLVPELQPRATGPAAIDSFALFDAVTDALTARAGRAPLMLVIDDLHWADPATLAMLRHLLHTRHETAILVVATYRDTEVGRDRPLATELAELTRDVHVDRVMVRGLDEVAVATMLDQFATEAAPVAAHVLEVTAGNPFFVAEIARHIHETGAATLEVPQGVKEMIGRRLSRLSDDANRLLAAGSVSGRQFDLSIAAAVVELDDARAVDAVEDASVAGLVREAAPDIYEFSHALVRDALYGELSGSRRTRFHRLTAERIETASVSDRVPAALLAHHYAESGESLPGGPAFRYSLLAAHQAASVFAIEEAIGHATRALEFAEAANDERGVAEAHIALGALYAVSGLADAAARHVRRGMDESRRLGDSTLFGSAVLALVYWGDEPAETEIVGLADEALRMLGGADEVLAIKLEARRTLGHAAFSRDSSVTTDARQLLHRARHTGDPGALAWAFGCTRSILGPNEVRPDEFAEAVRQAGPSVLPSAESAVTHWAAMSRLDVGDVEGARAHLVDIAARAPAGVATRATSGGLEAAQAAAAGRFRDCERLARDIKSALVAAGSPRPAEPWLIRIVCQVFEGRLAEAVAMLEEIEAAAPPSLGVRELLTLARCDTEPGTARSTLDELVADQFGATRSQWSRQHSLGLAARAAARLAHSDAAELLYSILRARAGRVITVLGIPLWLGAVDHYLGILAATLERFDEAVGHLEAALALHERNEWHALVAETQVELGSALVGRARAGDRERALDLVDAGLAAAEALGMAGVVTRARQVRGTADVPPLPSACRRGERRLVGRDAALARLVGVLDSAGGERELVLMAGEPGIGKTEVLAAFGRDAHARGAAVLYGTCDEEPFVAYQPFVEALRHLLAHNCAVDPSPDVELIVSPHRAQPARGPEPDRWFLFEAVSDLLARVASRQPVVLLLDDLQWADGPTLALLRHLVRRGDGPMVIVGAYRDTDVDRTHPFANALADLTPLPRVQRTSIGALSAAETAVMAGAEQLGAQVHELTAGNPFFVREVLRHFEETGDTDAPPESVRDVVGQRVARLAAPAEAVLGIAAVVGFEFDTDIAAVVAGVDVPVAQAVIEEAARARLVGEVPASRRVAFAHALVRETLYRTHATTRRLLLHRQIGEALEQRRASGRVVPAAELAHHFGEAAAVGCADRALTYAVDAAEHAATQLAYEDAARHYQGALVALDLLPDEHGRRTDLLLACAEQQALASDIGAARRTYRQAAALARDTGDAVRLAAAALGHGRTYYGRSFDRDVELLEEALGALDAVEEPVLHARVLARLARSLYLTNRPRFETFAPRALEVARAVGDPVALRESLYATALRLLPSVDLDAREAIELEIIRLGRDDLLGVVHGHGLHMLTKMASGRRDEIDRWFEDFARAANDANHGVAHHAVAAGRAHWAIIDGDLMHAKTLIREAAERGRGPVGPLAGLVEALQAGMVAWLAGDETSLTLAPLTPPMEQPDRSAPEGAAALVERLFEALLTMALATLGRLPEARAWFEHFQRAGFANIGYSNDALPAWCALAEAATAVGNADAAAALYEQLLPYRGQVAVTIYVGCSLGVVDHALGLLARIAGRTDDAVDHLEFALDFHRDRFRSPVFTARSEVELAATLLVRDEVDDRRRARELLESAFSAATAMGMRPTAERASTLLHEARRPSLPRDLIGERGALVGRDEELNEALSAQGRLLLVTGEPGIGKTRLVAELARRRHDAGDVVLYGRCDEDGIIPFQPFVEAIRPIVASMSMSEVDPLLGRLFPELATESAGRSSSDPEFERYYLFEAIAGVIRGACRDHQALLLLDDLHWADRSTLLLLLHLVRADDLGGLRIVACYRDTDLERSRPLAASLVELRRDGQAPRLDLVGIDAPAVAHLLASRLGDAATSDLVQRVHIETAGNPLFATLVADHLADAGGDSVPEGVREVIGQRVSRLPDHAQETLAWASVIGPEFELGVLRGASGADEASVLGAVEQAIALGIVREVPDAMDHFRFTHALVASTLYGELRASRRLRMHLAIAEAIEALPASTERVPELARHFGEAASLNMIDKAVHYARQAAMLAMMQVAYAEAARWYEHGRELLDLEPDKRADLRSWVGMELAEALFRAGDHGEASRQSARVVEDADVGTPELLARAALVGMPTARLPGLDDDRWRVLDEAIANPPKDDPGLYARLLFRQVTSAGLIMTDDELAPLADEGLGLARGSQDPAVIIGACSMLAGRNLPWHDVARSVADAKGFLATAERIGDVWAAMTAMHALIGLELRAGHPNEAREWTRRYHEVIRDESVPTYIAAPDTVNAMWALLEGRFSDAERAIHAEFNLRQAHGGDLAASGAAMAGQIGAMRFLQGLLAEFVPILEAQVSVFRGLQAWTGTAALAHAHAGNPTRAREYVAELRDTWGAALPRDVQWPVTVAVVAELCIALDDKAMAEWLYPQVEQYADQVAIFGNLLVFGSYSHHLGQLARAAGWSDKAVEHLRRGLEVHDAMGARAFAVWSRHALATALVSSGDVAGAANLAEQAAAEAAELGIHLN